MASPYAVDWNPLAQAIQNNQQLGLQQNRLAMENERLGFERELQPLRVKSTQQSIDIAGAQERRAADLAPYQVQNAQLGVDAAKAEKASRDAGIYLNFLGQFTDPSNPNYQKDEGKYAENWDKMLNGPFKSVDLLGHPDIGPLLKDPKTGPALAQQILSAHASKGQLPSFGDIGVDPYGQPQKGWINQSTQTVKPAVVGGGIGAGVAQGDGTPAPLPRGQALLDGLKQQGQAPLAEMVKAVAEGREPWPTNSRLPQTIVLQKLVSQYDPTFDASNYNARLQANRAFMGGGKIAQTVMAPADTLVGHLNTLDKNIDELGNNNMPLSDAVREFGGNRVMRELNPGGAGVAQSNFGITKSLVVKELVKLLSGSGGSLTEKEDLEKKLDAAKSTAELKAASRQALDLMDSRLTPYANQWNAAFPNKPRTGRDFLSPESRTILEKLEGKQTERLPATSKTRPRPAYGAVEDGFRFEGGPSDDAGDPKFWKKVE